MTLQHPEYANWMIEATPAVPYGKTGTDLAKVERNMVLRRQELRKHLTANEEVLSLPVFPRLGARGFTADQTLEPRPEGPTSRSIYVPDESIQPHPRFPALTAAIRERRGEKVEITVPVFKDKRTYQAMQRQAAEIMANDPADGRRIVDRVGASNIYMDAMAFGMGAGCLQVTLQAADVSQARVLYDQLAVVTPIMLALTAASPMWKGLLADTDVRWNVISASVDDRSAGERGHGASPQAAAAPTQHIPKSRYSSIDCFLGETELNREEYTDQPVPINDEAMQRLRQAGIDERMARHVAHLWIRDPLVIYREKLEQAADDNDHFENLQSTNWNTMRFKPPPAAFKNPHGIKWRVEFRVMEVSLTDFENAAFSAFIVLLARAIIEDGLDLYMPISKIDSNMDAAHARDAVTRERFWFRQTHTADAGDAASRSSTDSSSSSSLPGLSHLTVGEILNGAAGKGVVGLLERARGVLDREGCAGEERARLDAYLSFIGRRASGELKTTAGWLREFVLGHPAYCGDSVVSDEICYDLMVRCAALANGSLAAPDLVPAPASHSLLSKEDSETATATLRCSADSQTETPDRSTSSVSSGHSSVSTWDHAEWGEPACSGEDDWCDILAACALRTGLAAPEIHCPGMGLAHMKTEPTCHC